MTNKEFRAEAATRFPDFNKEERYKLACLLRRKKRLEELVADGINNRSRSALSYDKEELAALTWVLHEFEIMEDVS